MSYLPQAARPILPKIVRELSNQENVCGLGVFGSWTRGDAIPESDLDILVVDKRGIDIEFTERVEFDGLLVDFNYIPRSWIIGRVPPRLDQKLFEVHILYDSDWRLTNAKDWMLKAYRSPGRINVRTENQLMESDIYISRAASGYVRRDYESTYIYTLMAMEAAANILIDIISPPISPRRFLKSLREAATKAEMRGVYTGYLKIANLEVTRKEEALKELQFFQTCWSELSHVAKKYSRILEKLHFETKAKINYCSNSLFAKGVTTMAKAIIDLGYNSEAVHYLLVNLLETLECYAWVAATREKLRPDYSMLLRGIRGVSQKPPIIYESAIKAYKLQDLTSIETEETLNFAKDLILAIRRRRKELINKFCG